MSAYLLSIIGIVLLSAILTAILPEGKSAGLIKSVTRMVCILAIISPILSFFQSGSLSIGVEKKSNGILSQSVIEMDSAFIHYHSEMRISETETALKQEIFEKFSVDCAVELFWEMEADRVGNISLAEHIKITKICIKTLEEQDEEVLRNMWEYLTKNYCSEVLIE